MKNRMCKCRQSIALLIVLLCFHVELDWFTEPAAAVQLSSSRCCCYCTRKSAMYTSRTFETFGWRAKESLGALSLRNNDIDAHIQVTAVCRWPTCAKLGRTEVELQWKTDRASRTCCRSQTFTGRTRFPKIELNKRLLSYACINWK